MKEQRADQTAIEHGHSKDEVTGALPASLSGITEDHDHGRPVRISREAVIELLRVRGSAEGLDLTAYDLSGVNLSKLDLTGAIFGSTAKLAESDPAAAFRTANLEGAIVERAVLRRVNLGRVNLRGARFYHTDLSESTLWGADAAGADFRKAALARVDLFSTTLRDCRLAGADLSGANLALADLDGAALTSDTIRPSLIQENREAYREYFRRWSTAVTEARVERHLDRRYAEASEIYRTLKNAFLDSGRYDDASWAYFKERQTERKSLSPKEVRRHYADQYFGDGSRSFRSRLGFYARHLSKWALACVSELSTGYGERPVRVVLWSAIALLVFPLLYWLSGGLERVSGPLRTVDHFHYSLAAFSTIGFPDLVAANDLAKTLTSAEALIGISALALLMYTLGKRIGRN